MKRTCENCGRIVTDGLFVFYADPKHGYSEKCTCSMCYTKHLIKYYPHATKIIEWEINRMDMMGYDVSEFKSDAQPKLF